MRLDSFLVQIFCNLQIEARIVDEDYGIGSPLCDVLLAEFQIAEDCWQMHEHRNESHVCQFLIVSHTGTADSRHQVAAEETELCLGVFLLQRPHQM